MDDTTIALSQNTSTSPVLRVVVLVRTPTAVPGARCAESLGDLAEETTDRDGGVEREATGGRGEACGRGRGASVPARPREWEASDDGTSSRGGRERGSRTLSRMPWRGWGGGAEGFLAAELLGAKGTGLLRWSSRRMLRMPEEEERGGITAAAEKR